MRPREVLLLDDAIADLRDIRQHIYEVSRSRTVADKYLKRLRYGLRHLDYTAEACPRYRREDGGETPYRFTPLGHYIAFFIVEDDVVKVDRILHSRRDFGRALGGSGLGYN
ncbi:type II toxin-antitoxin system RelE/ParE family toxin [Adlercreutzia faecimuris]|uniref:Type II toxin-antitoxin system RelE/ParE family toxin n=1 Tax=Adlercreutzia faecimuris TaxID=2897341 RepID=A0ABS9WK75_9ACTN|nr:type II toxin-antitoxin system RelE/ParE family toxin [Adlercreutzia sp. JBNU-10]MCI2242791.1 type II toxin-antitoxin system RelE/ParE family toxin [Adlercreutzia sp. JBNU-10]